jgi:hypothetical protein
LKCKGCGKNVPNSHFAITYINREGKKDVRWIGDIPKRDVEQVLEVFHQGKPDIPGCHYKWKPTQDEIDELMLGKAAKPAETEAIDKWI